MSNEPIKIVITDDHEVIIDALTDMLNNEPGIKIVGKALNGEILQNILRNKEVDIALMDIEMPGMDGIEMTSLIKKEFPDVKVLILSQHNDAGLISQAIKNGAHGYILKSTDKRTLVEGIFAVARGELFTGGIQLAPKTFDDSIPELTDREVKIICLTVQEKTSQEIADELFLSVNTINQHKKNIYNKLGVKNVVRVVNYAHKHKLCS